MQNTRAAKTNTYIADIDGLRAIAVIAVMANHLNKIALPGGFLGVDIFFVISGFVITLSLCKTWRDETLVEFILGFYSRRARRILPALLVYVIILSVAISFVNQDPQSFLRIGSHSILGISNLSLHAARSDYFAPNEVLNPFLQTWSLGVEEQFYLMFPLLFFGCFRYGGRLRLAAVASSTLAVSAASFAAFSILFGHDRSSLHYLPGFRFWEMGLGVVAYWAYAKRWAKALINHGRTAIEAMCALLFLVVMSVAEEDSVWTIPLIAITTALFISLRDSSRGGSTIFSTACSWQPLVSLGRASYSLYLWHWGIICIANWTIGVSVSTLPVIILTTGLSTYASHKFVEKPCRKIMLSPTSITIGSIGLMASCFYLVKFIASASHDFYLGERARPAQMNGCSGSIKSHFWIYGDSHTEEMQKALAAATSPSECIRIDQDEYEEDKNMGVEYIRRSTGSIETTRFWMPESWRGFGEQVNKNKPRLVIINKYWLGSFGRPENGYSSYDANNIRFYWPSNGSTVSHEEVFSMYVESIGRIMENNPGTQFIIIAPEPEFDWVGEGGPKNIAAGICDPQWFNRRLGTPGLSNICKKWNTPASVSRKMHEDRRQIFMKALVALTSRHKNAAVFDTVPILCPGGICSTHDKDGRRLYQDDDHLSEGGVEHLASPMKRQIEEVLAKQ